MNETETVESIIKNLINVKFSDFLLDVACEFIENVCVLFGKTRVGDKLREWDRWVETWLRDKACREKKLWNVYYVFELLLNKKENKKDELKNCLDFYYKRSVFLEFIDDEVKRIVSKHKSMDLRNFYLINNLCRCYSDLQALKEEIEDLKFCNSFRLLLEFCCYVELNKEIEYAEVKDFKKAFDNVSKLVSNDDEKCKNLLKVIEKKCYLYKSGEYDLRERRRDRIKPIVIMSSEINDYHINNKEKQEKNDYNGGVFGDLTSLFIEIFEERKNHLKFSDFIRGSNYSCMFKISNPEDLPNNGWVLVVNDSKTMSFSNGGIISLAGISQSGKTFFFKKLGVVRESVVNVTLPEVSGVYFCPFIDKSGCIGALCDSHMEQKPIKCFPRIHGKLLNIRSAEKYFIENFIFNIAKVFIYITGRFEFNEQKKIKEFTSKAKKYCTKYDPKPILIIHNIKDISTYSKAIKYWNIEVKDNYLFHHCKSEIVYQEKEYGILCEVIDCGEKNEKHVLFLPDPESIFVKKWEVKKNSMIKELVDNGKSFEEAEEIVTRKILIKKELLLIKKLSTLKYEKELAGKIDFFRKNYPFCSFNRPCKLNNLQRDSNYFLKELSKEIPKSSKYEEILNNYKFSRHNETILKLITKICRQNVEKREGGGIKFFLPKAKKICDKILDVKNYDTRFRLEIQKDTQMSFSKIRSDYVHRSCAFNLLIKKIKKIHCKPVDKFHYYKRGDKLKKDFIQPNFFAILFQKRYYYSIPKFCTAQSTLLNEKSHRKAFYYYIQAPFVDYKNDKDSCRIEYLYNGIIAVTLKAKYDLIRKYGKYKKGRNALPIRCGNDEKTFIVKDRIMGSGTNTIKLKVPKDYNCSSLFCWSKWLPEGILWICCPSRKLTDDDDDDDFDISSISSEDILKYL